MVDFGNNFNAPPLSFDDNRFIHVLDIMSSKKGQRTILEEKNQKGEIPIKQIISRDKSSINALYSKISTDGIPYLISNLSVAD
ncbi:MAG: hypothetical protein AB8V23_00990 [Candidatus Midichloria sp.]